MPIGPIELVSRMAGIFDELGLRYALGGSMAAAMGAAGVAGTSTRW